MVMSAAAAAQNALVHVASVYYYLSVLVIGADLHVCGFIACLSKSEILNMPEAYGCKSTGIYQYKYSACHLYFYWHVTCML